MAGVLASSVSDVLGPINDLIINPIIALLFALATIIFLWGIVQFILNGDSEDGRKQGVQHMIWGVIGLAIMLAAFGIINLILGTLKPIQPSGYEPPATLPR